MEKIRRNMVNIFVIVFPLLILGVTIQATNNIDTVMDNCLSFLISLFGLILVCAASAFIVGLFELVFNFKNHNRLIKIFNNIHSILSCIYNYLIVLILELILFLFVALAISQKAEIAFNHVTQYMLDSFFITTFWTIAVVVCSHILFTWINTKCQERFSS